MKAGMQVAESPLQQDGRPASTVASFVHDLVHRVGARRVAGVLGLVLLCTVAESFGLLALVPLLQLLQEPSAGMTQGWAARLGLRLQLGPMLLGFMALMLARAWLGRQRDILLLALRLDYVDALRRDVEVSLAGASWRYLVRLRHADVMHLLNDDLLRINQGTFQALQLLSGLGLGLASLLAAAVVAPAWSLLLLLPLAALAWLLRGRLAASSRLGAQLSKGQLDLMVSSRDLLGGLKMIKAHALEDRHVAELRQRSGRLHQSLIRFARTQSTTRGWFELAAALVVCAFVYAAISWGHSSLPELVLTVLAFSRLMPVLRDGQLQLQQLLHMLPAFASAQAWLARNALAAEPAPTSASAPLNLRRQLCLDGVSFRYEDSAPPTLRGLSLQLPAGSCTALTGPSGSGKTTLADLALGLLAASEGRVSIDGTDLADPHALQAWRRSVAYVSQDTYLFPASVRDNLCWLAGPQPDADIWQALEQADAASFVAGQPGGLDQVLGERGEGLSGGQRQRLALARALLCRPALLVLDEVTSHLDGESESRINAAIRGLRGRMTILLIAHRPSALAPAERVLVLEAGRIVSDSAGS